MQIKVYSTPTCPYCIKVKEYLASRGVAYQNFDVSSDQVALDEMVRTTGQMGVPVIVVDSEVIVGFDKDRLDSLLGI
jgi:glutaredoxin 3